MNKESSPNPQNQQLSQPNIHTRLSTLIVVCNICNGEKETIVLIPPIGTNIIHLIDNMGFHQHIPLGIILIIASVNAQGMIQNNMVIYLIFLGTMVSKLRQMHQDLYHRLTSRLLATLNHNTGSSTQGLLTISPMIQPI